MHTSDLARFEQVQLAPGHVFTRSCRSYAEVDAVVHPLQPAGEPRAVRTLPFHEPHTELGAVFLEAGGWERPQWFAANANLPQVQRVPPRTGWAALHWSPIGGAEALAARERVAMFDLTPANRLQVTGPGALPFRQTMTTNHLVKPPAPSRTRCCPVKTAVCAATSRWRGSGPNGSKSASTVQSTSTGCAGTLPGDGTVQIHETTPGTSCVGLWGPLARRVLQPLSTTDFSHDAMCCFTAKHA